MRVNARSGSAVSSTCSTLAGSSESSAIISLATFFFTTFNFLPICKPIKYIATNCVANALVDATAISGPAWVYKTASDSRGIVEPFVLQTENIVAPFALA
ncbi:unannotated protein [freshwater metagenome]|uniref:Unannotated protein n=1 Tax=freshwater metagenome TaxID=449393 RepID=A0A6J7W3J9_9ZZZZ